MRPIVTDGVSWSVCRSVCHDRAKTAEPFEMQFGMQSRVDPGNHNHALDGVNIGATWRIRLNPFVCDGDAALYQIKILLTTSYYYIASAVLHRSRTKRSTPRCECKTSFSWSCVVVRRSVGSSRSRCVMTSPVHR